MEILDWAEGNAEKLVQKYLDVQPNEVFSQNELKNKGDYYIGTESSGDGQTMFIDVCFGDEFEKHDNNLEKNYEYFTRYAEDISDNMNYDVTVMTNSDDQTIMFQFTDWYPEESEEPKEDYASGGKVKEKVFIEYLNKDKGYKMDRKYFNSYQQAERWARDNFDKFDTDYIRYEYGQGGKLKEEDYVWNALGKKLIVNKVTDDEYYLTSFGQSSASPFSKKKVDGYIKNGEWSLKPKYAKGGKVDYWGDIDVEARKIYKPIGIYSDAEKEVGAFKEGFIWGKGQEKYDRDLAEDEGIKQYKPVGFRNVDRKQAVAFWEGARFADSEKGKKMADGGELEDDTFVMLFKGYGFVEKRGSYGSKTFYNKEHNAYIYYDPKYKSLSGYVGGGEGNDEVITYTVEGVLDFFIEHDISESEATPLAKGGLLVQVGDKIKTKSGIQGVVYESTGQIFKLMDSLGVKSNTMHFAKDFQKGDIKTFGKGGMEEKKVFKFFRMGGDMEIPEPEESQEYYASMQYAKGGEIKYVGDSKFNDGINENLNFKYTWEGNGKKHTTDYTIAITNRKWDGTKLDKFIVENKQRIPSEMLNGKEFNSIEEAKKALFDYYKIDKSNNMGNDPDYGRYRMGGSMAMGGETNADRERMYNFLKDDLVTLQKSIEENNQEEIDKFFSYWNHHLNSLEPKMGSKRMYNFLKDDLVGLEAATKELPSSKEETDRFFSYWNTHLKSLSDEDLMNIMEYGGMMADGGDLAAEEVEITAEEFVRNLKSKGIKATKRTSKNGVFIYGENNGNGGYKYETYFSFSEVPDVEMLELEEYQFFKSHNKMAKGGTFDEKVNSIAKKLEGKPVPAPYRKEYGSRYDKNDAQEAARRIVGNMRKLYGE